MVSNDFSYFFCYTLDIADTPGRISLPQYIPVYEIAENNTEREVRLMDILIYMRYIDVLFLC